MSDPVAPAQHDEDVIPPAPELQEGHSLLPLLTQPIDIDEDTTGARWVPQNEAQLAHLIAIIAMGQASYAGYIIRELAPASPAFTKEALSREAVIKLTVQEESQNPRTGYPRWQRDGFMFESISWIAAQQDHGERALLMTPHVSATSQGLDGLMIRLSEDKTKIIDTTIFEDKCSEDPRKTFLQKVLPAFLDHHRDRRSAEVVAAASVLLERAGFDSASAAIQAGAVTNRKKRSYRAAFAVTEDYDSLEQRRSLFRDYDRIDGISAKQRIGASFVVDGELRDWFDRLAIEAISYLRELAVKESDV